MKYLFNIFLSLCLFFVVTTGLYSQVTNLTVNGSSTSFTMTSGDTVTWSFNIPTGATASAGLWYDVNANGTLESNTDIQFLPFTVTDGDQNGNNGPPDMDGAVNGAIYFKMAIGIAPGHWIFKAEQNSVSQSVSFEVLHLSSPAHVISGRITAPAGQSAKNILVGMEPQVGEKTFWHAVTDSLGDYHIEMNADTAGNPWKIRLIREYNPFPGYILTPEEYEVTITGNHSGFDFAYVGAAAKIVGYLRDDDNNTLPYYNMWLGRFNMSSSFSRDFSTDGTGFFFVGLAPGELSEDDYQLSSGFSNDDSAHQHIAANFRIHGIHNGDSLFYNVIAYKVNSSIRGQIKVNGGAPGFSIELSGMVQDTAYTSCKADASGNFVLETSNKLYNYQLWPNNLPSNYFPTGSVTAHPGQTGIIVNITMLGVSEREQGIPSTFSLGQNYPNPFNPSTTIDYDIAVTSNVHLSIYNILGNEVLNVVNQQQAPGKYTATIDASTLSSGIYFYRLTAGTYSEIRKMVMMK